MTSSRVARRFAPAFHIRRSARSSIESAYRSAQPRRWRYWHPRQVLQERQLRQSRCSMRKLPPNRSGHRRQVAAVRAEQLRRRFDRFRATIRWQREHRSTALQRVVSRTARMRWSPTLIRLLLNELVVGDDLRQLIGPPDDLPVRRHPQAVAVALALRYSYREDMLRNFIRRLRRARRGPQRRR